MKFLALPLMLLAGPTLAEIHEVRMLNRGESGPMVYEPAYLNIAPGDTVRFLPTQPGHNAATIEGIVPTGAAPFRSKINDTFEVTLTAPGVYGIKCSPHYAMGMVIADRGRRQGWGGAARRPAQASRRTIWQDRCRTRRTGGIIVKGRLHEWRLRGMPMIQPSLRVSQPY